MDIENSIEETETQIVVEETKDNEAIVDSINEAPESFSSIAAAKRNKKNEDMVKVDPIGLNDSLSEEDMKTVRENARKNMEQMDAFNPEVNLAKDRIVMPNQEFCSVAYVGMPFKAKTKITGFRIQGAFKNLEEATEHSKMLKNADSTYDNGIMQMYHWCLGYPLSSDIVLSADGKPDMKASQEKMDNTLNEFIVNHKTKIEVSKEEFKLRNIAVRRSEMKVERPIEEAELKNIIEGDNTQKIKDAHNKTVAKWNKEEKMKNQEQEHEQEQETTENKEEEVPEVDPQLFENATSILNFECKIKVPGQEYAVVSFVDNQGKNRRIPICIKGVFETEKEANDHIEKLMHLDDTFDMVAVPMYKWIPSDPDTSFVKQKYTNDTLNNMLETEENQKEEAMNLHNAKVRHADLDGPINPNYKGKGSTLAVENIEEEEEEYTATDALDDIRDINTKSFTTKVFEENGDTIDKFKKFDRDLIELETQIRDLMEKGHTEEEAKDMLRVKMEDQTIPEYEPTEEDIKLREAKQVKSISMEEKIKIVEQMKADGCTDDEIRAFMSQG